MVNPVIKMAGYGYFDAPTCDTFEGIFNTPNYNPYALDVLETNHSNADCVEAEGEDD